MYVCSIHNVIYWRVLVFDTTFICVYYPPYRQQPKLFTTTMYSPTMYQLKFHLPQKCRYSASSIATMSVAMLQHFDGIWSILTCYTYGKMFFCFCKYFITKHFCALFCQRFVFAWTAVADVYNIEMLLVKLDTDWEKNLHKLFKLCSEKFKMSTAAFKQRMAYFNTIKTLL